MRGNTGFTHTSPSVFDGVTANAEDLLRTYGERLLDKRVLTLPYGAWPGGVAIITAIQPDQRAPEIVFMVRGEDEAVKVAVERGRLDSNEIGVFDHEEVVLLTQDMS